MYRSTATLLLLFAAGVAGAEPPKRHRGEFLQMWDAIMSGLPPAPPGGWFKPAQTRYTWERLKVRADKNGDGRVTAAELGASTEVFASMDRDGDGAITADDLDWSDNAPYFRQLNMAQQILRQGDNDGNRKLSKEEWEKLFERAAKGKPAVEAEDMRRLLFPPTPPRKSGGGSGMPSKTVLLWGLLTGEIGSGAEGPKLEADAPDFTLKSPNGKKTITLSAHRGKRPVVLIFGSFT
jgi:hypothetical protein